MHVSVHLADLGVRSISRWRRAAPRPATTAGLRWSAVVTPAPLGTRAPRPQFGRVGLIAFWDDEESAADAISDSVLAEGFQLGLEPVRAIGTWPGLSTELPTAPDAVHDGPAVVLTIGRLRLLQAYRFFPASARAEKHVVASPGLTWSTGFAAVERRIVATLSWWHDPTEMGRVARGDGGHRDAIAEQAAKDFHHDSAFIRFRPVSVSGALGGRNPVGPLGLDRSST